MTFQVIDQAALRGNFEGYCFGSEVTLVLERLQQADLGPRLHRHPYTETFVIRSGAALFTVGDTEVKALGGQILVVPALVAHKFKTLTDDLYEAIHIHANDRLVTEWLE